ncbi:MAG TPA: DUF4388 domain-containing protein [Candidatus Polarisedimenticolaceae bacterium]|nr:DUF4388 domain-containing protein [Candidatus Polarisedimenticolaceae bacterium]
MALEGTIKDFGLADILQMIGIQRKTGQLTLEGAEETVVVKFLEGAVVGADTRQRNLEDLLGSVLVRTGRITEVQLQEALRIQRRTLQRLGYVLVKQGFIFEEDLREALRIQVTQIVYRLFRWRDGRYQFTPSDHMEYDTEHFQPISAETILMEGARMIDEWPIIEKKIKSPKMVFRKTAAGAALDVPVASLLDADLDSALPERDDAARLSPEERDVLRMVDGSSTVQDLVDTSPLGEFDVHRLLYELVTKSLIEEVKVSPVAAAASDESRRGVIVSVALQGLVLALALGGLLTLRTNPLTPWRLVERGEETALLQTYASRNRLERLVQGLQIYYLEHGGMPATLERLAVEGFVATSDLRDPWGRRYTFRVDATGFDLAGRGPAGEERDDLVVRHAFTPSQRMVLEGGAAEKDHPAGP